MANDNSLDRKLARRYLIQFAAGGLLLASLVAPSLIHSAAAIGTLRNLPALWLPEDMPVRQDFFRYINQFAVTDTLMVTWPNAHLNDSSVDSAMAWIEPLSNESMQGEPVPEHFFEDEQYGPILELSAGDYPFHWVRSGKQMLDHLSSPPLNLSARQAANRLRGSFVGPDLKQTCLILSLDLRTLYNHQQLLPLIRQGIAQAVDCDESEVVMVGSPVDGAAIDGAAIRSIARFSLPSSAIAAILCLLCLRSIVLSATIVAVAMVTQGMVLASIYYAGYDLNAVLIILPTLVFVLTISSGVHLSNYFREMLSNERIISAGPMLGSEPNASRLAIVQAAMARGYKPCTMSVLTTVVGLLSLLLVRIQPVQLFGVAAAGALFFSLGMLFLMMPGAMLLARGPRFRKITTAITVGGQPSQASDGQPASPASRLMRLFELPLRHRPAVFLTFAVLTAVAAMGLSRLRSSVSIPDMFADDSQLNQSYRWFEEHIGPTMTGELLVTFDVGDDSNPIERFQTVRALHRALVEAEGVGGVNSGVTFLPSLPAGGGLASVTTRAVVQSMIEKDTSPLYTLGFLRGSEQEEIWRLTFRLFQTDPIPAKDRLHTIETQIERILSELESSQRPRTALTGHVVVVEKTQSILLQDLVRSFCAAFVVIAVFMSIMVGNVIGGLLSMIPNMIPTLILFGMMGWCEYALDIGSVMTASVALGIAVDDTLHLLAHFRAARRKGYDLAASARDAMRYCALAMLHTTIICGSALAIYYASEFKPTQRFAVFMGVLLAMAWLGVTVLLPAMMTSRIGRWMGSR